MMARLMLDYDGDVDVSEDGGIVYRFAAIRKTASETPTEREPPPAWTRAKPLLPLTGNPIGANVAIAAINAFNLFMGLWGIENHMTLERAIHLFDKVPHHVVDTGTPIVLGVVPLVFSALLFLLPLGRALLGKKEDDTIVFRKPSGEVEMTLLAVRYETIEAPGAT